MLRSQEPAPRLLLPAVHNQPISEEINNAYIHWIQRVVQSHKRGMSHGLLSGAESRRSRKRNYDNKIENIFLKSVIEVDQ